MSVRVMTAVWDSTVQPTSVRVVLLALADNANDGGLCKPGTAYLAGKTGLSRRSVFRAIADLESAGLLERRTRTRDNGSTTSSAYRINIAELRRRQRPTSLEERDELSGLFDEDAGDPPMTQRHRQGVTEWQTPYDGVSPPEPSLEPEEHLVPTADAAEDEQTREDVEQLCTRLVERVVENGCKRPTVTRAWRDEARRLIDRDGRSLDEALRLIDWCQADSFWRSNILSMVKFRKQYDALLLRARDTAAWRLASPPTRPEQLDEAALDELLAGERAPSVEAPAHLDVGSIEWQQWQNDRYQQWRRERAVELLEQRRRHA